MTHKSSFSLSKIEGFKFHTGPVFIVSTYFISTYTFPDLYVYKLEQLRCYKGFETVLSAFFAKNQQF